MAGGMTVARDVDGTAEYMLIDHLGSPIMMQDGTGAVAWQENLLPFGEKWTRAAANDNDRSFTGHIEDTATGLNYMQARYYNPVVGRFLSNDPVGIIERGPSYFNRYAYVTNDPINATDPFGLDKRQISRKIVITGSKLPKKVSVTVESGGLSQGETEEAMSGLSDSFFLANNGKDFSGFDPGLPDYIGANGDVQTDSTF